MNELWHATTHLGRARFDELLREAEAARVAQRAAHSGRRDGMRRRLGRALIWIGTALAGPGATQPANGN